MVVVDILLHQIVFGQTGVGTTAVGTSFINPVGIVTGIEITNSGTEYSTQ